MRPVHDVDALVLLATTLSSKRRPATLVEIVAAADLLQGSIPFVEKLGEAIYRLSGLGLLGEVEGGFTLTPIAEEMIARQPKKAAPEEVLAVLAKDIDAYRPKTESPPIALSEAQLMAAIRAHKASRKAPGKNMLMPKPKVDRHFKIEGRWRRASATRSKH